MLVESYQAHVGAQKPRQQQYSSELAIEICNTKPILQYTQTAQSGMSWIADDTLSNCNLIDHLGTTIGHTLGLYTTPYSLTLTTAPKFQLRIVAHRKNRLQKSHWRLQDRYDLGWELNNHHLGGKRDLLAHRNYVDDNTQASQTHEYVTSRPTFNTHGPCKRLKI